MSNFRCCVVASFCILSLTALGQETQEKTDVDPWAAAEAALAEHVAPLVKRLQDRFDDPRIQYAEFKSGLLRKYLPDYRVFAQDSMTHLIGTTTVFILDRKGNIVDLGDSTWTGDNAVKAFRVPRIMDFVKSQGIKIENADGAVEVAQLIEEIQSASHYVSFLRINTKNYTVFDKRFMTGHYGPTTDWTYSATKRDGGWTVKVDYVGPPADIMVPPTYELDVNEQHVFSDIRMQTGHWPSSD